MPALNVYVGHVHHVNLTESAVDIRILDECRKWVHNITHSFIHSRPQQTRITRACLKLGTLILLQKPLFDTKPRKVSY